MEYEFRPIGKKCATTGADLVPGSVCHSVLVEKNGDFERLDFSDEGWRGPPEGAVGTWKCSVPKAAEVRKQALDTDALFGFFEQLVETGRPDEEGLRYILALLLMRKRKLKLDGSRTEGTDDYLQLSGIQGEGAYEVRDLHLSDAEMEQLQQDLNARLATEFG